jgi:hypothetical protein
MAPLHQLRVSLPLKGYTLGRYPVVSFPAKDIFLVLSAGKNEYILQAYSSVNGALLAESKFFGKPSWAPYRLVDVLAGETIKLRTSSEMITLKIK